MSTPEERTRQAFQEIHVPDQVKQNTLDYIEAHRLESALQETLSKTDAAQNTVPDSVSADLPSVQDNKLYQPIAQRSPRIYLVRRVCAVAACLAFAIALVGGTWAYYDPTAYIDIDVNPSIELTVNRFDRVIGTLALNEDGQAVLDAVDVKHDKAQTALNKLTSDEACAQYIQDDSYVSISVVSENEQQSIDLTSQGRQIIDSLPCSGRCQSVDNETWQAAQSAHMGVGRYLAAQQLMELDTNISLEDCSQMTMRELRDRINELGGSLEDSNGCASSAGPVQGLGQGQGHKQHSHGAGKNGN